MRIPSQDGVELGTVRRFEAAGFRAWPAASVHYDGTWLIRLTAGLPAKRLNSVNPLDPGDNRNFADRIARAARRFEAYGRAPTFRLSPLAGTVLPPFLESEGWTRFSESLVMRLPLDAIDLDSTMSQIPLRDMTRFIGAAMTVQSFDPSLRAGLTEIISSIEPTAGLFVHEEDETPVASAICVHDGDLAGLFEVATLAARRGEGHGRRIVLSALKWAKMRGARQAWLQVDADNTAAIALYRSLGFSVIYGYSYCRPAGSCAP